MDASTIKGYPEDVIEYDVQTQLNFYEEYATSSGSTLEELVQSYYGVGIDDFKAQLRTDVEAQMNYELVLGAIAEKEGMTLSDEEYQTGAKEYIDSGAAASIEELETNYGKERLALSFLQNKAVEFLRNNAIAK